MRIIRNKYQTVIQAAGITVEVFPSNCGWAWPRRFPALRQVCFFIGPWGVTVCRTVHADIPF